MKTIVAGLMMAIGIATFSFCKKTNVSDPTPNTNSTQPFDFRTDKVFNEIFLTETNRVSGKKMDLSKILEICAMSDEDLRKMAVKSLSADDQALFWEYVVNYHIQNDGYNVEQKQLLTDLKNYTANTLFFTNMDLQQVFFTSYLPLIKTQLNNAKITDYGLGIMFTDGRLTYKEPEAYVGPPRKMKCDCGNTLLTICNSRCNAGGCDENIDCGFFWKQLCTGLCNKWLPTGGSGSY